MGDRGVIRCVGRLRDFTFPDDGRGDVDESCDVYVHWHGGRDAVEGILATAARILRGKQHRGSSDWRQAHFVADPHRAIMLIVLAAERQGANPEIHPPHGAPMPDREPYIVATTPGGWYVTGGDLGEERYRVTRTGFAPADDAPEFLRPTQELERRFRCLIGDKVYERIQARFNELEGEGGKQ